MIEAQSSYPASLRCSASARNNSGRGTPFLSNIGVKTSMYSTFFLPFAYASISAFASQAFLKVDTARRARLYRNKCNACIR